VRDVGDDLELRIEDDGRGFDPDAATSGFGLLGMRERAELLGGSLEVASTPGDGTLIVARLPGTRRAPAAPRGIAS
jgi:signal transduction histidine kinase